MTSVARTREPGAGARVAGRQTHGHLAFGCVLYERLANRPLFAGATTSDIVAATLGREPKYGDTAVPSVVIVQNFFSELTRLLSEN